jgi:quercetin dioxygenase-like cupin family protein
VRSRSDGEEDGVAIHVRDADLPGSPISRTFLGRDHGAVPISLFIQASPPGHGPGPHRHPYAEVFVLHEGSGSFLAGDETIEASGGSVVVVPAGEVHGFTASSDGPLRMTCIHTNAEMITEWVEPG